MDVDLSRLNRSTVLKLLKGSAPEGAPAAEMEGYIHPPLFRHSAPNARNHWKISRVWRGRPSASVHVYTILPGTLIRGLDPPCSWCQPKMSSPMPAQDSSRMRRAIPNASPSAGSRPSMLKISILPPS